MQPLDNRTLGRLESAVARSQYVGQGKKLKVVPKVCTSQTLSIKFGSLNVIRSTLIFEAVSSLRLVTELLTLVYHLRWQR